MLASQAQLIPTTVLRDVLSVCLAQPLNRVINGLHAAGLPHRLCGEVGVRTSSCSRMYRVETIPAVAKVSFCSAIFSFPLSNS